MRCRANRDFDRLHNPGGECLLGQLSDSGKQGMTELGSKLRKLYVEQLGVLPDFLSNLQPISLRSTDYARLVVILGSSGTHDTHAVLLSYQNTGIIAIPPQRTIPCR
jgi:hypothetical protein